MFFCKEEATSLNNIVNKKRYHKFWMTTYYDVFSFWPTGFYFFFWYFRSFFISLRRICLRAKVCNLVFIICSLIVGIDCVTDKLKATFSWMKDTLFCPQIYSPERWKSHFRALKFQNFLGQNTPTSYSNLLATSIFIETPEHLVIKKLEILVIRFCSPLCKKPVMLEIKTGVYLSRKKNQGSRRNEK